jgi:hypothetical protein
MATRIQVRRGTNTQWNTTDPVLNEGEFGYSTTDSQFKIFQQETQPLIVLLRSLTLQEP